MLWNLVSYLTSLVLLVIWTSPSYRWAAWAVFAIRVGTASVLLRNYALPFLLSRLGKHVRIRSISLRSVKGLKLYLGAHTISVDRIVWPPLGLFAVLSSGRILVSIQGVRVELGVKEKQRFTWTEPRHKRSLTLARFQPPRLRVWDVLTFVYWGIEPVFGPFRKFAFMGFVRIGVWAVPAITGALNFDLDTAVVTFRALPDIKITVKEATFHTSVGFSHLESIGLPTVPQDSTKREKISSVHVWKARVAQSVSSMWERAWRGSEGHAEASLTINTITGVDGVEFFTLSGVNEIATAVKFNPGEMSIAPHSMVTTVSIPEVDIGLDRALAFLQAFKQHYTPKEDLTPPTPRQELFKMPTSPLLPPTFAHFSASVVPRLAARWRPPPKMKDVNDQSLLLPLGNVSVKVPLIRVTSTLITEIHGLSLGIQLSDDSNETHCRFLGKSVGGGPGIDSDAYGGHLKLTGATLHRGLLRGRSRNRVASLESIEVQVLVSQFPTPWLHKAPFMSGDPNAPFVALWVDIGGIEVTEQLHHVQQLLSRVPLQAQPEKPRAPFPAILTPVPRIAVHLQSGEIIGRLVVNGQSLEAKVAKGLTLDIHSSFQSTSVKSQIDPTDNAPVEMFFDVLFAVPSLSMVVYPNGNVHLPGQRFSMFGVPEPDTLLSVANAHIKVTGRTLGEIVEVDAGVTLHVPSTYLDVECFSEELAVELWHVNVIRAVADILDVVRALPKKEKEIPSSPTRLLEKLPFGVSLNFGVERLVFFITGPDLGPVDESEGISRGVMLRTRAAANYCALRYDHTLRFKHPGPQAQTRHKLGLLEDRLVRALATAKSSSITRSAVAFACLCLRGFAIRSAVSTQLFADNPDMAVHDDPLLSASEFLNVRKAMLELTFSGKHGGSGTNVKDVCQASSEIDTVVAHFGVGHLGSVLLAARVLKAFVPFSPHPPIPSPPKPEKVAPMLHKLQLTVKAVQVSLNLPKQRVIARTDGIVAYSSSDGPTGLRWTTLVVLVPPSAPVSPWEHDYKGKYEEFICLQHWEVFLSKPNDPSNITLDGDSLRLRIPNRWHLSDLVEDIGVTVKCSKHLVHMVREGQYSDMPSPPAEDAKIVPPISLRVRCLSAEAADDPRDVKLALNSRAGADAVKYRMERDEAFKVKVAAVLAALSPTTPGAAPTVESDYHFTAGHTIPLEEAHERLLKLHELDWVVRLRKFRDKRDAKEEAIMRELRGSIPYSTKEKKVPDIVPVAPRDHSPPLIRIFMTDLSLKISGPSFPVSSTPDFLFQQGGLPRDTAFSLLVPLHISFTLSSLRASLRDYPLPLLDIPPTVDKRPAWEFTTNLVIAEEMYTILESVHWVECRVFEDIHLQPWVIKVPKTSMPVKTYLKPKVQVHSSAAISWGQCYAAPIQDLMRVLETLSSSPRDSSPPVGFWDKVRLVLHPTIEISFNREVRFLMKGSRNPYSLSGRGAGFCLCFQGSTKLRLGYPNPDNELIQVTSDTILIAIPDLSALDTTISKDSYPLLKVVAKVRSGAKFGVGFALERSCGTECPKCSGSAFERDCRIFTFRPHYEVALSDKITPPIAKTPQDSYNGFRSDFIHMSLSISSSTRRTVGESLPSTIHLSPQVFAHFNSWVLLFDGQTARPVRQGTLFPVTKTDSPKFGRHLATVKYRISFADLFVAHGYMDDSRETWAEGVTPFVGVKAKIDRLQVDMHQREEATYVVSETDGTTKVLHNKPLCAAEVVVKGLDLRTLLAIFSEPSKQLVPLATSAKSSSNYRFREDLEVPWDLDYWTDEDDFVEMDWAPTSTRTVTMLPVVTCPRIAYFKHNRPQEDSLSTHTSSKFGSEDTHVCHLGKEPSVPETQTELALERIKELLGEKRRTAKGKSVEGMVSLLNDYVDHLRGVKYGNYQIASDTFSEEDWEGFENVLQIHCPSIFIDAAIRDILLQYYHCSRARIGVEYQMSTRAVKFLRDSAIALLEAETANSAEEHKNPHVNAAQALLRKILPDNGPKTSVEICESTAVNPLSGWTEGVQLRKGIFGLLLKPQIILRSEEDSKESICILAAVQAKLQSYSIMDEAHIEDAVSGQVMTRNYTDLSGLQTFSPADPAYRGKGCIPLEVLLDLRCESVDFDRLVPQTDATFHWDKFNRLRLLNNNSSVAKSGAEASTPSNNNHLRNQTDRIKIHVPKFTVSASDEHFEAITAVVTKLVLFSDAAQQTRTDKLETLLFTYDFTDLASVAAVVSNLQARQRSALETQRMAQLKYGRSGTKTDMLKLKAHIFLLAEELSYLFSAIQMAQSQDRNDPADQKSSAVLLQASSDHVSWMMLDASRDVLAKLLVEGINYSWLRRRDAVTVNHITAMELEVFDMSPDHKWYDILSKNDDKGGLFIEGTWIVQPPVAGITIYDSFIFDLHPMRLQIDGKVGKRMFEYFFPARRREAAAIEAPPEEDVFPPFRTSLDEKRPVKDTNHLTVQHPLRKPRSFTDMRSMTTEAKRPAFQHTKQGSESDRTIVSALSTPAPVSRTSSARAADATVMKTRAHLKTFVLVKISSVNVLLSVTMEDSFDLREARIRTRELEYRNRTCTFEELVKQFIPDDMSWKGWVRMALNQPLLPVLPVARELISKTKWLNHKHLEQGSPEKPKIKAPEAPRPKPKRSHTSSPMRRHGHTQATQEPLPEDFNRIAPFGEPSEQETTVDEAPAQRPPLSTNTTELSPGRESRATRIKTLFTRARSQTRKSTETPPSLKSGNSTRHSQELSRP